MPPINIKPNQFHKAPEYWWDCCMQFIITDVMLVPKIHKRQTQHWKFDIPHIACLEKHCHHYVYLCYCFMYSTHFFYIIFLTNSLVSHGFFIKWLTYNRWKHFFYLPASKEVDWTHGELEIRRLPFRSCFSLWWPFSGLQFSQVWNARTKNQHTQCSYLFPISTTSNGSSQNEQIGEQNQGEMENYSSVSWESGGLDKERKNKNKSKQLKQSPRIKPLQNWRPLKTKIPRPEAISPPQTQRMASQEVSVHIHS